MIDFYVAIMCDLRERTGQHRVLAYGSALHSKLRKSVLLVPTSSCFGGVRWDGIVFYVAALLSHRRRVEVEKMRRHVLQFRLLEVDFSIAALLL
jgi:hypothetical protein